jgi:fibronectin type 3 domain-containing protein
MSKKIVRYLTFIGFAVPWLTSLGHAVTLEWDPNPETNVVGYRVYWGLASGNYAWSDGVSAPSTTLTISNLQGNREYFFAVTAVDADGLESDFSDEVSAVIRNSENSAPVAVSDSWVGVEEQPLSIVLNAVDADGDNLDFRLLSLPLHGTLGGSPPRLTYTPDPDFYGDDRFLFMATDGQGNSQAATISLFVQPANDLPTLDSIPSFSIKEDGAPTVVDLSGISSGASNEGQKLTVTAFSANPNVIPNPTVSYISPRSTGTLTLAPVSDGWGTASITVIVSDGVDTITRVFTVTVNAVNDRPTLNPISNININEDSGPTVLNLSGITSGAANEVQPLTLTAISGNPSIIPNPAISYSSPQSTATLTLTPAPNTWGVVPIGVIVSDGLSTVTRVFIVAVKAINDPPTLDLIPDVSVSEDSGVTVVNMFGIGSGAFNEAQTLTVTAASSDPGLVPDPTVSYASPARGGMLSFTPVAHRSGAATIAVTVSDGETAFSRSFNITVRPVNWPPIVDAGSDRAVRTPAVLTLSGSVSIQGVSDASALFTMSWSKVSGPGSATFGSSNNLTSTVSFSAPGEYVLRLTASDGERFAADDVIVEVLPPAAPVISDLVVAAMDARTIGISLHTDQPTTCLVEFGIDPSLDATMVEATFSTDHFIRLTHLEPATNYLIRIRSTDMEGNVSTTGAVRVSTPPIALLNLPADAGVTIDPVVIGSDGLDTRFAWSPTDDAGSISFDVPIEVSSQYRVWCRVRTFSPDAGSFYVSNDSNAEFVAKVGVTELQQGWRWMLINQSTDLVSIPGPWNPLLTPALHRFVFRAHEALTLLQGVVLSNDPDWIPSP